MDDVGCRKDRLRSIIAGSRSRAVSSAATDEGERYSSGSLAGYVAEGGNGRGGKGDVQELRVKFFNDLSGNRVHRSHATRRVLVRVDQPLASSSRLKITDGIHAGRRPSFELVFELLDVPEERNAAMTSVSKG
jgi:hypothetical protein